MGRTIVKLTDGNRSFYMEWSSMCDAPLTPGMSLEDFTEHYRWRYGVDGLKELPERLERVEKYGTSLMDPETPEQCMSCNRAGKDETRLTYTQILDAYCLNPEGETPLGKKWTDDDKINNDFKFDDREVANEV